MPCGAKTGLFSFFFTEQRSLINKSIKLPSIFLKGTEKIISSLSFRSYYNDIANIIRGLDPNKTHIPDMISTRMLKICGESISKSLEVMFKSRFKKSQFPDKWGKGNAVSIHKKGDKLVSRN